LELKGFAAQNAADVSAGLNQGRSVMNKSSAFAVALLSVAGVDLTTADQRGRDWMPNIIDEH